MKKNRWLVRDLKRFKKIILEKQKETQELINRAKEDADNMMNVESVNAIYSSHMADAGSDHREREKAFFWIKRETDYLQYLNRALELIEDRTFGICKECGEKIPEERLMEVPHTSTCYDCKIETKKPH